MSLSQLQSPSFTVVLASNDGSTILRDHQRAQSREIQIPISGPQDDGLLDTMDMRTPTGFIVYKCEYARDQDTATFFEDDIQTAEPNLPSFTIVLTSDHGSTILRDHQRAQNREIQIPIFGPWQDDGLLDTMDMRTPTGFIVYRCEYAHDRDTATLFEDDIQTADPKGSFWSRLKMFCKGLGRK